jgi:glycosyltransferase involved in cell wall biosynthesis
MHVDCGLRLVRQPHNLGKGVAVKTGVTQATGTHLIVLDADLEYSPSDIPAMLAPVLTGRVDQVFGSRIFGINTCFRSFKSAMSGRLLTLAANLLYNSCLTDMHTCLNLVPLGNFRALTLSENKFGMDTEITGRVAGSAPLRFRSAITSAPWSRARRSVGAMGPNVY